MMQRASRFHRSRLTIAAVLVGLITAAGLWTWNRVDRNRRELLAQKAKEQEATRIEGLVGRLVSAEPNQLPDIVKELDANPEVAATYLSPLLAANATTVDEKRRNCMLASRWFPATGRSSNHCWKNCSPTRSFTSARFVSNCVPTRVSSRKNSGPSCGTRKPRPFAASAPQWRWRITFPNPRRPRGASRT